MPKVKPNLIRMAGDFLSVQSNVNDQKGKLGIFFPNFQLKSKKKKNLAVLINKIFFVVVLKLY